MTQTNIFSNKASGECASSDEFMPYKDMPDAEVLLYPHLFSKIDADRLFETLLDESDWKQEQIKIHGKKIDIPRLTAWCGEPNKTYIYSGIRVVASPWTNALLEIKERIEAVSDTTFNSVLLNLYRHGADSVAWHTDDEPELGKNPVIGSISLGAMRKFQLKHQTNLAHRKDINLESGSYLLMQGKTQRHWLHQIPKTARSKHEAVARQPMSIDDWKRHCAQSGHARINLTFREIKDRDEVGDSA